MSCTAVVTLAAFGLAACGGSSSKPAAVTTTTSSGSTTGAPTSTSPLGGGPASASISIGGDGGLTGVITTASSGISCSFPSVDGLTITVLSGTADPNISTFMFLSPGAVRLRVASGSGTTYRQREFDGTGVTGFDGARGAHIDSPLHENKAAAYSPGNLPGATSIKGDISCGGQRPGSSTIVLSGDTGGGTISGGLDPVRVQCSSATTLGKTVNAVGIAKLGRNKTLVFVNGQPGSFSVVVEPPGAATKDFKSASGTATTSDTGMHVSGDAVEQVAAGATAHTVHASGDAVCGATGS